VFVIVKCAHVSVATGDLCKFHESALFVGRVFLEQVVSMHVLILHFKSGGNG